MNFFQFQCQKCQFLFIAKIQATTYYYLKHHIIVKYHILSSICIQSYTYYLYICGAILGICTRYIYVDSRYLCCELCEPLPKSSKCVRKHHNSQPTRKSSWVVSRVWHILLSSYECTKYNKVSKENKCPEPVLCVQKV